jgi:TPP-dependent pyruvate/acetoin dehydrogenase alpha subunit
MAKTATIESPQKIDFDTFKTQILADYRLACESREASLLGRKEVLTGKAKFGIFGDGKELAQIALAKQFKDGDFRAGYYRDQTMMLAIGQLTLEQYFAGLYAHTNVELEPLSAGRQMGGHYSTRNLDSAGEWKNLMQQKKQGFLVIEKTKFFIFILSCFIVSRSRIVTALSFKVSKSD